jgi:hypothetical protein
MCEKCYTREIRSFPTYEDFDEFYSDFTRKISGLKSVSSDAPIADAYECRNCQTIWCLSFPDNSWRGFFLKESSVKSHLDHLAKEAKEKREEGKKVSCY